MPFSVELENKYEIVVYPNPAFESIEISANAAFNGKPNFICDVTGKEIKSGVFSYPLTRISVSELNSGIYILKAGIEGEGTF